jgi:hypothetical protein
MYDDDEDEASGPGAALRGYLSRLDDSEVNKSALGEIIYTANETGLLECGVSYVDAITIWKMVELASSALTKVDFKEMIAEIRM